MSSGSNNNESTSLKKIYIMFGIFALLLITWVVYTQVTKSENSTKEKFLLIVNLIIRSMI